MENADINDQLESRRQDILYLYYNEIYEALKTRDIVLHNYWLQCLNNFMSNL